MKRSKNEVAQSLQNMHFSSYLTNQKENIQSNISSTIKGYLHSKKEKSSKKEKRDLLLKTQYSGYGGKQNKKDENANYSSQRSRMVEKKSKNSSQRGSNFIKEKSISKKYSSSNHFKYTSNRSKPKDRKVLGEIDSNKKKEARFFKEYSSLQFSSNKLRKSIQEKFDNMKCESKPKGKRDRSPRSILRPQKGGESPQRVKRRTKVEVRDSFEKEVFPTKNCIQLDPTRKSTQESGIIKSYAVNTNEGLVRDYNEDRVSIILNIMQSGKENSKDWPKAAFFGVYDGHCGASCAEFLRDNLHKYILRDKNFPEKPEEALRKGFMKAEKEFLKKCIDSKGNLIDRSGSCALVALVVKDKCYIANVGDSRAVLSRKGGKEGISMTNDHKPCEESERERILKNGGKVYRTQIQTTSLTTENGEEIEKEEIVNGPYRVFPGRLSVCRTIGDFEAKLERLGGNSNVIIATPEISVFDITEEDDFVMLGCDGVFDRFTTEELVDMSWKKAKEKPMGGNMHEVAANLVEDILQETFQRKAWDNITVVLICFKHLYEQLARGKNMLLKSEKNFKGIQNILSKYKTGGSIGNKKFIH